MSFYDIVDDLISKFNENSAMVFGHGEVVKVTEDLRAKKSAKDKRLVLKLQRRTIEKMDRIIERTHDKVIGYRSSFIDAVLNTSIDVDVSVARNK